MNLAHKIPLYFFTEICEIEYNASTESSKQLLRNSDARDAAPTFS